MGSGVADLQMEREKSQIIWRQRRMRQTPNQEEIQKQSPYSSVRVVCLRIQVDVEGGAVEEVGDMSCC